MFERLKAKWNINSNVQLIIIFIVFAITGSLSLQITKPILIYIGVDSGYLKTFFLGYFYSMLKNIIYIFCVLLFVSCTKSTNTSSIKVVGEMRDVMWKGDLKGKIATDSLNNTKDINPVIEKNI